VAGHVRRGGGRNTLPDNLPRERVEHDLAEQDKACPGCSRLRERIGSETSEMLEFVPAVLKVIEHVRWKYACRGCQEHVAVAPAPAKPLERGLPGPGLLAAIVVGKFSDHLPLYRLEDVFARSGVELGRSTLCRWARHTAKCWSPSIVAWSSECRPGVRRATVRRRMRREAACARRTIAADVVKNVYETAERIEVTNHERLAIIRNMIVADDTGVDHQTTANAVLLHQWNVVARRRHKTLLSGTLRTLYGFGQFANLPTTFAAFSREDSTKASL